MRTKAEAIQSPRARDQWKTVVLRRTVISKKRSFVAIKTEGRGRMTTIELMELFIFRRWAEGAEYMGVSNANKG